MLYTGFDNPSAKEFSKRYIVQWITNHEEGSLRLAGYCVRDTGDKWKTLFRHKDETVCRKVCDMLNEGDNKC